MGCFFVSSTPDLWYSTVVVIYNIIIHRTMLWLYPTALIAPTQCYTRLFLLMIHLRPIPLTHWGVVTPENWVNIGSGNGLLPDGTKPLPEPMLTDHQWSPVTFILGQFHKRCLNHQSLKSVWKLRLKFNSNLPGANELIEERIQSCKGEVFNSLSVMVHTGSGNCLSPVWHQTITKTNVDA